MMAPPSSMEIATDLNMSFMTQIVKYGTKCEQSSRIFTFLFLGSLEVQRTSSIHPKSEVLNWVTTSELAKCKGGHWPQIIGRNDTNLL
jgi:hypothetical protein